MSKPLWVSMNPDTKKLLGYIILFYGIAIVAVSFYLFNVKDSSPKQPAVVVVNVGDRLINCIEGDGWGTCDWVGFSK